ncbi:MAG: hypothetical protein M1820_000075 [Bogoriella megaspora]|nr:MAG: hypothetical protein M1820_000075 [Bogoriella megaspora]
MDLLKIIQRIPGSPPFFTEEIVEKYGEKAVMPDAVFPTPFFAKARIDSHGRRMPQVIAHRGYKEKYPENSFRAFESAVEAGAHAVETDVHLSKDGVVVLSHDADLKRCFGVDRKVKDCEWAFLKTLRTTRAPNEPMCCLQDLLKLLQKPKWMSIWMELDIKFDDDSEELMRRLAETFDSVQAGRTSQWKDKVLLGCWTAKFMPLCSKYFPGFPIANIGFSMAYSSQFLAVPNAGFIMLQPSIVPPWGRSFTKKATAHGRQIYAWTVNDEKNIDWCIRRGVDGIVTDDAVKVIRMCEKFDENVKYRWTVSMLVGLIYFNFYAFLFGLIISSRYGLTVIRQSESKKSK